MSRVPELQALARRLADAGQRVMQIQTSAAEVPDEGVDLYRRSTRDVVITADGTEHTLDEVAQ